MGIIEDFFCEIDREWHTQEPERIPLRIIGSCALMLRTSYVRGTKDGDVWHALGLPDAIARRLEQLAGRDSAIHKRRKLYIDIVANGLPLLPFPPVFHPIPQLDTRLTNFSVYALDVVDVVVSKLKRFHGDDRSDISAMIDRGLVPYEAFRDRFLKAMDRVTEEEKRPRYFRNFNQVERDMFFVDESPSPYEDE